MLAELFSWWIEQMRGLAAPLTRRASGQTKDALLLECEPGIPEPEASPESQWRILRRRRGEITWLATVSADHADASWGEALTSRQRRTPVVIALAAPFLVRRATLPIAASSNVERVLGYEMDRLTPFAADDVLFSHRILARDNSSGTLLVEVAFVPKAWVRELLERLAKLSIWPEALEEHATPPAPVFSHPADAPVAKTPGSDQPARRIPLDLADPVRRARVRLARRSGESACAALAVAVLMVPFIRQSLALATVEDNIARLRPRMEQVDALRRRIAAGSAGAGQIAAARQRQATALRVIGVLTDLMPDDTFLTSISLRRGRLSIEGHSAAATKLIATMAADPQLTNPSFAAPVVRAENGTDVFTIQAGFGS